MRLPLVVFTLSMSSKYPIFSGFFACAAVLASVGLSGCPQKNIDTAKSQTRIELAYDALRANQLEIAEKEANAALGYNPNNAVAYNVLGLADQIRAARAGLLIEFDDCLQGLDAEVIQNERDRALTNADAHFAQAIRLAPDYGEAFANRGNIALQMEEYDRAQELLMTALGFHGRLQSIGATRAHLGWAYFQQGNFPQAAKELRQALQFSPELCIALYRLGRVYFARQEWNNAEERFTAVTKLPRCQMQEAYLYLSKTQAALGQTTESQKSAQQCVALAAKSCLSRKCSTLSGGMTQ